MMVKIRGEKGEGEGIMRKTFKWEEDQGVMSMRKMLRWEMKESRGLEIRIRMHISINLAEVR